MTKLFSVVGTLDLYCLFHTLKRMSTAIKGCYVHNTRAEELCNVNWIGKVALYQETEIISDIK